MNATHLNRGRTFDENVDRWAARVVDRLRARNPNRPVWDRTRFLAEMENDHPHHPDAALMADRFEAALEAAHGNPAAFKRELRRLTVEYTKG
jgi:hypothetical protein